MSDPGEAHNEFKGKLDFNAPNLAELWRRFKQKIEFFINSKSSNVADKRKVGILMTALGDDGLDVYNSFQFDGKDPTYAEVIQKFDEYCEPRKNNVYERFVFNTMVKKTGQNFSSFVVDLKRQAVKCQFVAAEEENMIRDRLVVGHSDEELRRELLKTSELTLTKALQSCQASESAKLESTEITKNTTPAVEIDRVGANQASASQNSGTYSGKPCGKCSYYHQYKKCPAYGRKCNKCKGDNHFAKACNKVFAVKNQNKTDVVAIESELDTVSGIEVLQILSFREIESEVRASDKKARYVKLRILEDEVVFKLDTGAECDILSLKSFNNLKRKPKMLHTNIRLRPFGSEALIQPIGKIVIHNIEFIVVNSPAENLLGLQTCEKLGLVHFACSVNELSNSVITKSEQFVKTNIELFSGVGKIPGVVHLYLKDNVQPSIASPRRFPYMLLGKLKTTLNQMVSDDIITKVTEPTDWVSHMLAVEKSNGSLRICLDPPELNGAIKIPKYQIPQLDDIISVMSNKKVFSVLDLASGFWHLELDESSSWLTTFASPFGRYRFKRLCFGINCAPEIFMQKMVEIFGDIEGVRPYFDDIIVAASTEEEHDQLMEKVLERAKQHNLKFNPNKLQYKTNVVKFLGVIISPQGVRVDPNKIKAILELPTPTDKDAVHRFLGLLKSLSRFIPDLSQQTENLRYLTKKNVPFNWTEQQEKEFQKLKQLLVETPVLKFFDASNPNVVIQTDSSKSGLGCCLMQDAPIAFASRALTNTEIRYSQIEKELLAIVFAVKKFHNYIYGRQVIVKTDHKPLVSLVQKPMDKLTARLQRLRLQLLRYNIDVQYLSGKEQFIADTLSRAYLNDEPADETYQAYTVHSTHILDISVQKKQLFAHETEADEELCLVKKFVEEGWPKYKKIPREAQKYFVMKDSITTNEGVLLFENRLIVPRKLVPMILGLVHETHLGIVKSKQLARLSLYWSGMSNDIEEYIRKCDVCATYANNNQKETLLPYPVPQRPWERIGIDIATHEQKDYLVCYDSYSNWLEVLEIRNKSAETMVQKLKSVFARLGIPDVVVSDNVPFNSESYKNFAHSWGFIPVYTSPHYPQSNGLAEKGVSIAKSILRKSKEGERDLAYGLLMYRTTPLSTGFTPSQLIAGRILRTKIPVTTTLLKPKLPDLEVVQNNLEKSKAVQKYYYDQNASDLSPIPPNTLVTFKNDLTDKQWKKGKIVSPAKGPRSYMIEDDGGATYTRNRRFIRRPARYND